MATKTAMEMDMVNIIQEKHPKLSQIKSGRKDSSTEGNLRDVEQGSHCRDLKPLGRGIYQQLFLVEKKDGGNRPVINLKHLNQFIPYQHFKMEGFHWLGNILKKGNYICKLDLKDAYFGVPLNHAFRKFVWFL